MSITQGETVGDDDKDYDPDFYGIPKAVSEIVFTVFGVQLRCFVLDNGHRIVNGDDTMALLKVMSDPSAELNRSDLDGFVEWCKGS